jgi:hypothetical protein
MKDGGTVTINQTRIREGADKGKTRAEAARESATSKDKPTSRPKKREKKEKGARPSGPK